MIARAAVMRGGLRRGAELEREIAGKAQFERITFGSRS